MDFIEPLPTSDGFDSILVIVDRLTKWSIYIPTTTTINSQKLAQLILDNVIAQHGIPESIVSDRGTKFVSRFWKHITSRIGIQVRLSTAYHPQTDGQTERMNQILEHYLRTFGNYLQDDWSTWLGLASFVYNNSTHSGTQHSPFFANFGYHPRWIDDVRTMEGPDVPTASQMVTDLLDLHSLCSANIAEANRRYSKYYDAKRIDGPRYKVGDLVLLSLKNIKTKRPSKKLDLKLAGPYPIIENIGSHAHRLQLPPTMKIHNVFHTSLLQPYRQPSYPTQNDLRPGPIEIDDDGEIYEISTILNSRNNPHTGKLEYLIEWVGYEGDDSETGWEPKENLVEADEYLADFHTRYPDKPRADRPRRARPRRT